jgi:threonine dehydratase
MLQKTHTPVGAFKIRGDLSYFDALEKRGELPAPVSTQLADGMAGRIADQQALDIIAPHIAHIVQVTDDEVARAMRQLVADTHKVAEGAGAASFAAAMPKRDQNKGQGVGTVVSGGNVDSATLAGVLGG